MAQNETGPSLVPEGESPIETVYAWGEAQYPVSVPENENLTEIVLEWGVHRLFVLEDVKDGFKVIKLVRDILEGDKPPAIQVYKRCSDPEDKDYSVGPDGHHRALAHYLAGKPLGAVVLGVKECPGCRTEVPDMTLSFYDNLEKDIFEYLEQNPSETFLNENPHLRPAW